jgi:hypothetical protein
LPEPRRTWTTTKCSSGTLRLDDLELEVRARLVRREPTVAVGVGLQGADDPLVATLDHFDDGSRRQTTAGGLPRPALQPLDQNRVAVQRAL